MKAMHKLAVALAAATLTTACSKSSDSAPAASESLITSTFTAVNTQAAKMSKVTQADMTTASLVSSADSQDVGILAAPSFGAYWSTTAGLNNIITNSGNITAKQYMGYQLSPTAKNTSSNSDVNVFGRMKTNLGIFCAVGIASDLQGIAVDENRYPANGSYTVTFTSAVKAAMSSTCGVDVTNIPTDGTMTLTVESATGSFDKKFTFSLFQQSFFVRSTASEVNIISSENQSSGMVSRSIVMWNKTANILRVEYVSNPGTRVGSGLYAYRLYYDETNDVGRIMVYEGNDTSATQSTRYILAGKPSTGDAFSLSMKAQNVESGSKVEACVLAANGNIDADGARCTASATRLNGAAIDSMDSIFTDFFAQKTATTWYSSTTTTTSLGWTDATDMLTVALTP